MIFMQPTFSTTSSVTLNMFIRDRAILDNEINYVESIQKTVLDIFSKRKEKMICKKEAYF